MSRIFHRYFFGIHAFFISDTFISNARLKLAKNKVNARQHPRGWTFDIWKFFTFFIHSRYHPKIIGHILKNKQQNKSVCIHTINHNEKKMKMKNRSRKYSINRPRYRQGRKYSKHKKCLSIMVICIKQHLSNIWSSIHEKVKQHWVWIEKKALLIKKCVL